MSVELLDGATIINFVEYEEAFSASVWRRFNQLDIDQLRRSPLLCRDAEGVAVRTDPDEVAKVYGSLFAQFDHDSDGEVGLEEYMAETKKIMLSVANGLGFMPVKMVLEDDSLLMGAVDRESSACTKVAARAA
ncbi:Parvalbumin [Trema orientale]|uniref:Parvalbumin n=1 Tax=Trema orientale TaxID=63057 RepID=A0A2P5C522_TREOI|nr:Parvalbumin [Trema orientale]